MNELWTAFSRFQRLVDTACNAESTDCHVKRRVTGGVKTAIVATLTLQDMVWHWLT